MSLIVSPPAPGAVPAIQPVSNTRRAGYGKSTLLVLLTTLALSAMIYNGRVSDALSDPLCSLITAQSIVENGSLRLDAYEDRLPEHHCVSIRDGHYYDYFPPGTSVLSLPFVAGASLMGSDMLNIRQNARMQRIITALCTPLLFILFYLIGRAWTDPVSSYVISLIFFLGSAVTSSLATALWSHVFSLLCITTALLLLVRYDCGIRRQIHPTVIALLLFTAYACRPPAVLFILSVALPLLWSRNRAAAIKMALTLALLMSGFSVLSYAQYGTLLPPYYLNRMAWQPHMGTVLYGLLLSPSRGLFIYRPFLLVTLSAGLFLHATLLRGALLPKLLLLWVTLHIALLVHLPEWSGGLSYGPRLLVDSLPAWLALTFILHRHMQQASPARPWLKQTALVAFLALGALALWINTVQGLNNNWTQQWSGNPRLREEPERMLFDWRYPQFLATGPALAQDVMQYLGQTDYSAIINEETFHISFFARSGLSPQELNMRGLAYEEIYQYDEALSDFTQAIAMNASDAESYVNRGTVYIEDDSGRTPQGCADLRQACALGSCEALGQTQSRGICP